MRSLFALFLAMKEGQPCTTPNKARGECIQFKKCDSLLKMIQKVPLYDEDITFLKESQCGYDKEPLVCLDNVDKVQQILLCEFVL